MKNLLVAFGLSSWCLEQPMFERLGLGLMLWSGTFEGKHAIWLRWCRPDEHCSPPGADRAEQESKRAERFPEAS